MKTKFLVSAALLAVALGVRPAAAVEFWSVDIQGAGSGLFGQSVAPLTVSGSDPTFGLGNVWNAYNVPGHDLPAAVVPAINLVDRDGVASGVSFGVTNAIAGWGGVGAAGGAADLFRDYMFVQAGNSPVTADFVISGLTPGIAYDMINFGGVARDALVSLDLDGDGDLAEESGRLAPVNSGGVVRGILASPTGQILGRVANGTGDPEGNWAGFHLFRAPPPGAKLWSVDIHGAGSNLFGQDAAPAQKSGIEAGYGLGNVWNHVAVPGYDLEPAPVSAPLVDSEGNATSVEFNITTPVQGWGGDPSMGVDPLRRDYLFAQAGRSPQNIAWNISGLEAGHVYEMFAYSGALRAINLSIDQSGETAAFLGAHLFGNITADANGMISGVAFGTGTEANWSGFQLRDVTPIPEPATWAMLGTAGIALLAMRRRRA